MNHSTLNEFIKQITTAPPAVFESLDQWRQENQASVLMLTRQLIATYSLPVRKIPLKTLNALLTHCGYEYDSSVQQRWSRLLANAITANNPVKSHYTFVEILRQLSYEELHLLDYLYQDSFVQYSHERTYFNEPYFMKLCSQEIGLSYEDSCIALENLQRLQLIEWAPPAIDDRKWFQQEEPALTFPRQARLSLLGLYFTRECNELII